MRDLGWQLETAGDRCVLARPLGRLLAPYALLLAITLAWYPLAGAVLAALAVTPASSAALVAFTAPIAGLALWVPRLARERRRIVLVRDAMTVTIDHHRIDRARLDSVAAVHERTTLAPQRHVVVVRLAQPTSAVPVVDVCDAADAHRLAAQLASWLALPVHVEPPNVRALPRAIVVEPPRDTR